MVKHIKHHNVRQGAVRKRELLRIGDKIEPWCELDVRRNKVVDPLLQIADTTADLESRSRNGTARDPVENVIVDRP